MLRKAERYYGYSADGEITIISAESFLLIPIEWEERDEEDIEMLSLLD